MQYGILDLTTLELVNQQVFDSSALAHQWLTAHYPSLQDTEDHRGHHLGGQRHVETVLPHSLKVVQLGGR